MNNATRVEKLCPVRRVGSDPGHHFFGYYNKNVWDRSGRYFLSNRVPMMTGDLTGHEIAEVGYFDLEDGDAYHVIGSTTTWNWQMGCQLQWLEGKAERQIIYNRRRVGSDASMGAVYPDFCSVVHCVDQKRDRELPLPVYVVAPNSCYALCVNYSRFEVTHKTIGYRATRSEPRLDNAPGDDGIFTMDIETGEAELIISLERLRTFQTVPSMDNAIHWVTHLEINPTSSRFLFIHRGANASKTKPAFCTACSRPIRTVAISGCWNARTIHCRNFNNHSTRMQSAHSTMKSPSIRSRIQSGRTRHRSLSGDRTPIASTIISIRMQRARWTLSVMEF